MRCAGIDIGSRTVELVVVNQGKIIESRQTDTGFDPLTRARVLLEGVQYDHMPVLKAVSTALQSGRKGVSGRPTGQADHRRVIYGG